MNLKKIIAAVAASAVAVSAMAVSAFAAITLDAAYPGDWSLSAAIPTADLEAIGGDVKIVLTVETSGDAPYIMAPTSVTAEGWIHIAEEGKVAFTGEKLVAKADGFILVQAGQTTVEMVMPASAIPELGDAGLAFQVNHITVKSAELSAGTAENPIIRISENDTVPYCNGEFDPTPAETEAPAEEAAPVEEAAPAETEAAVEETEAPVEDAAEDVAEDLIAEVEVEDEILEDAAEEPAVEEEAPVVDEAPAADTTTPVAATGNTAAAAIVAVMAVAGAAAVATKKRK